MLGDARMHTKDKADSFDSDLNRRIQRSIWLTMVVFDWMRPLPRTQGTVP